MAIIIKTNNPSKLLDIIYEGIDKYKLGKWTMASEGKITPSTLLWKNEAFLKPQIWVEESELRFGLIKRKDRRNMPSKIYTHFHTKFVEMLLENLDTHFVSVTVTSMKTEPDDF